MKREQEELCEARPERRYLKINSSMAQVKLDYFLLISLH